jgi:CBS domain containing-hemolysin-like protein
LHPSSVSLLLADGAAGAAAAHGPSVAGFTVSPWGGLLLGLLLVLLNGFFVAAEFALVKVRPTQIEPDVARGSRRARLLEHLVHHLDGYLSATQLGVTLASLGLGWVGEPAFAWVLAPLLVRLDVSPSLQHSISLSVAFATITVLHIVLGELAPKWLAIRNAKPVSLWVVYPLHAFYKVTYPAIWLLRWLATTFLGLFGVEPVTGGELAHSEEELRLLVSSTTKDLSQQKRELLDNVFELTHRVARQIMVPRGDVVFLSTTRSVEENLRLARTSGHTRFPLCRGGLDQAVGLVHIKDLFRLERAPTSLEEIARPLAFVPETLTLEQLLRKMRGERMHLAAVLDEYGGVSGIVTLENVIEEIVGEIQDEFDLEKPELVPLGGGRYQVDARMLVEDLEDALEIEFSERDEDTIGGVVLSELGRVPKVGDEVNVGPLHLRVADAAANRIKTLELELRDPGADPVAE